MNSVYTSEIDISHSTSGNTMNVNLIVKPNKPAWINIPIHIKTVNDFDEMFGDSKSKFEKKVEERKRKIGKLLNDGTL